MMQSVKSSNTSFIMAAKHDAIGEIIEHVIHNGGEAVFMPQDIMGEDQPIALVTRY